jgi:hypothetical protein
LLALAAAAGCGRGGFDPAGDASVGAPALVPSNGLAFDPKATGVPAIEGVIDVDTDTGEIRLASAVLRAAGPGVVSGIGYERVERGGVPIGVLTLASLRVAADAVVRARGQAALAVVVSEAVVIDGLVEVGANQRGDRTEPGPAGGAGAGSGAAPAAGCAPGGPGRTVDIDGTGGGEPGGGGGGYGSPGGDGGDGIAPTAGRGMGGRLCGSPTLEPLIGGSGGGAGGVYMVALRAAQSTFAIGGAGGGGGGAVQITAATSILVGPRGAISAGGAGGDSARPIAGMPDYGGGGGGGAGGGILLEAPSVTVAGTLAANGGGGGSAEDGTAGEDGGLGGTPARGGIATVGDGGAGAAGGALAQAAPDGSDAGGGGGGGGRIRINSIEPLAATGTISPPASLGALRAR